MSKHTYSILAVALICLTNRYGLAADSDDARPAPTLVRLYFRDGTNRPALLVAQSDDMDAKPNARLRFRTSTGEVAFSVDSLLTISDIFDRDQAAQASALFRVDHGSPRRLRFGEGTEKLLIENPDGTREIVDLRKIARLQVIRKTAVASGGS